ncbi:MULTISPECIES: hypothetical protein [Ramlibacter]|uniref:Spore coat protein U domain-containing protein n=1 Tax=Ramlibacter pinisoli TaxID=2682844 RepID=A0A6N8IVY6_9BURK|nr:MULTISPECIES: hypothetical protein [Ramlibacter]MBA2965316.1 hypothetical protein [Ramlibacter sp. CGMCC 1.13660]MVQ30280.1 hypothetical protein [Ramlibacter pinisoli]
MKRLHLLTAAAATLVLASGNASAQTVASATKNVDVKVNFTAKCQLATGPTGAVTIDFGPVQAFATADVPAGPVALAFECTRGGGVTPTFKWDTAANSVDGGGTTAAKTNGSIAGLRYELRATPGTDAPGADPVLTAGATATNGTPRVINVSIDGTLFAGAGSGASGAQTDSTRVLTVSY